MPIDPRPADPLALAPGLRRLTAPNPSPFTHTGTQTYIVGTGEVAVIDPGPAIDAHLDAIIGATAGERVAAILVTHNHRDHSPAAGTLSARTGAPVLGCAPLAPAGRSGGFDASFDADYRPYRSLADGDAVAGPDWTLTAVATPGHTSNHLCFAWAEGDALFSGDHVMGWSTTVIIPPDGDMGDYLASLEKLAARGEGVYYPGHGEPVDRPARLVRSMIGHRRLREGQIVRLLDRGVGEVAAMVGEMYAGLDPRLIGGATGSVTAHLLHLERRGLAVRTGEVWGAVA